HTTKHRIQQAAADRVLQQWQPPNERLFEMQCLMQAFSTRLVQQAAVSACEIILADLCLQVGMSSREDSTQLKEKLWQ
ncbi:hypothetical protein A2U01_0057033, partial [Trifolium medium]|nr:hypothetical protein [Trifolium medium]